MSVSEIINDDVLSNFRQFESTVNSIFMMGFMKGNFRDSHGRVLNMSLPFNTVKCCYNYNRNDGTWGAKLLRLL